MAAEKVGGAEGGASSSERGRSGGEEMNGNSSSGKGVMVVGGGGGGAAYHRWNNGDAVPLKRRRVGLSNGGSVSDGGGSTDEEEEEEEDEREDEEEDDDVGEDAEEVAPEELSDDYEDRTIVGGAEAVEEEEEEEDEEEEEEEEEAEARVEAEVEEEEIEDEPEEEEVEEANEANEEEEDDEQHLIASSAMDHRGGSTSSRGREPPIEFDEHDDVGTDDEGYEEEHAVSDSPPVARARGREREREIEMSFPEDVGGRDSSDDSDEERVALPLSRKIIDRGQSSASEGHHHHREIAVVPQKPARGLMDTAKRKAVPEFVAPRNGSGEPKQQQQPKKPRAPAAPRRKANGEGTTVPKARTRFSTDNKARVTLERAREILATVKAAMLKQNSKQFTVRHPEPRIAVENSSSSEDERKIMPIQHQQQSRAIHQQQVKVEEKVVKKRSRAAPTKAGKEPTPRRRKPKVEVEYHHATEEKSFYRGKPQQVDGSNHDHHAFKLGHFPTSGAEASRMEMDDHHNNGYSGEDGYEQQQITVVEKKARKRRKTKEAEDVSATGLCPGSVIRDENWVPPQSPYGLIQESLYKDPWKVLLSCMLLNKTAGRQMHKVIWDLFSLCPDAETAINMDTAKIAEKVYSLGLQNKRAKMIQRFSLEYLRGDWTNVTQLHGIGKYAADAYAIFCQGLWREVEPDDLMLNKYWKWLWETNGLGADFTPEAL